MLTITGLGMVTAVGHGAMGTLAALRADVSRPRALHAFRVEDGEGGATVVAGHPVTAYADGFCAPGAWVRLALGAFADMVHRASLPSSPDFWNRTGLTLLGPAADAERFPELLAAIPDAWERLYARPVAHVLGVPLSEGNLRVLGQGHCALAEALKHAEADVAAHRVDRVVVLAADSYLDGESLEWLQDKGRLQSATHSSGTQPGEAGTALLLEADTVARARGAERGGRVRAVATEEASTEDVMPEALGRALAEVARRVLPREKPFRGDVLLDLNGEDWKGKAWGSAQMYLTREHLDFERCRLTVPAECLGEVGAASAPLAVGVAVGAFLQGHNPEGEALVLSLSDSGRVAAVHLESA
ncbi:hypothetical protein JY651_45320 [Pyxidicoccus parkwayensis]|uniref:Beta-ketoacyl synthase n=1 Tax=Pyxidicoccus parkwayensis TaxID=2813578 RepID=A0ABX7NUY6_9BACT|nr:hypothetical protein [Pyxidicoccus parkwaysis]QSQ22273.1 hypothetical protein JY651_45320 [Pyxidicoccus parkwaysis]